MYSDKSRAADSLPLLFGAQSIDWGAWTQIFEAIFAMDKNIVILKVCSLVFEFDGRLNGFFEAFIHVKISLCRCFEIRQPKCLSLFSRHVDLEVTLCANQDDRHFVFGVQRYLLVPYLHFLETISV